MSDPVIAEFRANEGHVRAFADKHLLLLTVPGRRSGHPRTTPLLYLPDGDAYVVFGLNGGAPSDPAWVGNLATAGRAEIEIGGQRLAVVAERATGSDADDLWRRQATLVPEFEGFRARTGREIPVIRLRPDAGGRDGGDEDGGAAHKGGAHQPSPHQAGTRRENPSEAPRERRAAGAASGHRPAQELDVDAVLFDMDGTLVDSEVSITATWTAFARRHGLDVSRVLAGVPGRTAAAIVADHLSDAELVSAELERTGREQSRAVDGITEIPGADALLRSLPRTSWAVVTAAPLRVASRRLEAAGLPRPPVLVGAEDVLAGKPDPEGYLKAARALGVAPERCLVVEDSPAGIEAGVRAGARVLRVGSVADGESPLVTYDLTAVRVSVHERVAPDGSAPLDAAPDAPDGRPGLRVTVGGRP